MKTVLGVMIHEISQIFAGYFLSSFFVLFILFFGSTIFPHHSFQCSQDCSPGSGHSAEAAEDAMVKPPVLSPSSVLSSISGKKLLHPQMFLISFENLFEPPARGL